MNKELTDKLFNKYPKIFQDKDKSCRESLVCFGFEFDSGWANITEKMLEKLQLIQDTTGIEIIATQMKEKFGTGRFYYYTKSDNYKGDKQNLEIWLQIITTIVDYWEFSETANTCEVSGKSGWLHSKGGWVKTLCDEEAIKLGFKDIEEK